MNTMSITQSILSLSALTIRLSITALAMNLPRNLNFVLRREICDSFAVRPSGLGNRPNIVLTYAIGTVGVGPPVVVVVVVVFNDSSNIEPSLPIELMFFDPLLLSSSTDDASLLLFNDGNSMSALACGVLLAVGSMISCADVVDDRCWCSCCLSSSLALTTSPMADELFR